MNIHYKSDFQLSVPIKDKNGAVISPDKFISVEMNFYTNKFGASYSAFYSKEKQTNCRVINNSLVVDFVNPMFDLGTLVLQTNVEFVDLTSPDGISRLTDERQLPVNIVNNTACCSQVNKCVGVVIPIMQQDSAISNIVIVPSTDKEGVYQITVSYPDGTSNIVELPAQDIVFDPTQTYIAESLDKVFIASKITPLSVNNIKFGEAGDPSQGQVSWFTEENGPYVYLAVKSLLNPSLSIGGAVLSLKEWFKGNSCESLPEHIIYSLAFENAYIEEKDPNTPIPDKNSNGLYLKISRYHKKNNGTFTPVSDAYVKLPEASSTDFGIISPDTYKKIQNGGSGGSTVVKITIPELIDSTITDIYSKLKSAYDSDAELLLQVGTAKMKALVVDKDDEDYILIVASLQKDFTFTLLTVKSDDSIKVNNIGTINEVYE